MKRIPWWAVIVAVAVAVVVAVAVTSRPGTTAPPDASGSPSSSEPAAPSSSAPPPSPVPTPAPSATGADQGADASDIVAPFVLADAAAKQDPAQPLQLDQVATGAALDDLTVQVTELAKGGLSQVGSPTVVSAEVTATDPGADPPTMTVLVCLDYTEVDLVNGSGDSAKDPSAPQRVPSILTFIQQDGAWLVSDRSFPDDPTC